MYILALVHEFDYSLDIYVYPTNSCTRALEAQHYHLQQVHIPCITFQASYHIIYQ